MEKSKDDFLLIYNILNIVSTWIYIFRFVNCFVVQQAIGTEGQ